jgi:type IX secretion system PorP/SprF family membrane protein
MKKLKLFICFVMFFHLANAQQVGMLSHYFYKPMLYNPAFTGHSKEFNAMLISHSQWTAFKGGPELKLFTIDGILANKKAGLGFSLLSDRKGINSRLGGNMFYSYNLEINDETFLAFGLSFGVLDQTIDYSKAIVENSADPTLFTDNQRKTSVDGSAGLAFTWKNLEFGAAIPQILGNKIEFVDNFNVRSYYSQVRHFMSSLKYRIFISEKDKISLAPQMLARYVPNTPLQYDGNLSFEWKDKCWFGVTYKSDYAMATNVGFCIHKQFCIGYSYDFMFGKIGTYGGLSHEIMMNFKFGKAKKPEPRIPVVTDKVPETETKTPTDYVYEKRVDSLKTKLKENDARMKELLEKMEQQASIQAQIIKGNETQSTIALAQNNNKELIESFWLVTNSRREFKDQNFHMPEKAYYVVAGTFMNRDFAIAWMKRLISKGYKNSSYVYHEPKQYNYVFIQKVATKEEAIPIAKAARDAGLEGVWVLVLVE